MPWRAPRDEGAEGVYQYGVPTSPESDSRDLIAAAAIGIVSIAADARILSANNAALVMLGRREAELVGLGVHEALNGQRPAGECELEAAIRAGRATQLEEDTFTTGSGTALPVWWAVNPLRGPDDTLAGAVLVFGDTSVQRARQAASAAERAAGIAELALAQQNIADLEWAASTSQAMSSTLDEDEVMHRLVRLTVGRLADFAVADLVTDGIARPAAHAAADDFDLAVDFDAVVAEADATPLAGRRFAVTTPGSTVDLIELAATDAPDAAGVAHWVVDVLRALTPARTLIVPMIARGHIVGMLTLARQSDDRPFSAIDRLAAADISLRAALAVDNARLYRAQADIATRLQRALLPRIPPMIIRTAARYLPARDHFDVGGDWYDAFHLPNDAIALVVGDVAGHDLAAGTTMSALRNLLRGVSVVIDAPPEDVLSAVDESLDSLSIEGTATVLLAHVAPHGDDSWSIRWSNAGHMPPVLIGPDGSVEMLSEVHGSLLGTGYRQQRGRSELIVPAGTTMVLYTDGLVETRDESIDTGLVRLRRSIAALEANIDDTEAVADELLARNHASVEDDTALLVCHLPALRD